MNPQLFFILSLEALGLVLAIVAFWSMHWRKQHSSTKKIEAALETHLHGMLTAELEVVEKELKKVSNIAGKEALTVLHQNHSQLQKKSQQLLEEFSQTIAAEMTALLKEQREELAAQFTTKSRVLQEELEAYKQTQIAQIDARSDALLAQLLRQKVWRSVQAADQHAIAKRALAEVLASGELSG